MSDLERKAIELLCGECDMDPEDYCDGLSVNAEEALAAIIAALAPPDGYLLVPVEPTPKMVDATWYHPIDSDGGIESQNTRNKRIWSAMLAARPEVK